MDDFDFRSRKRQLKVIEEVARRRGLSGSVSSFSVALCSVQKTKKNVGCWIPTAKWLFFVCVVRAFLKFFIFKNKAQKSGLSGWV